MPPTLPFEIWACIASYLSNVELKTLSSVNRALCQISLNAWYKTLQVHQLSQYTVAKLQMMRDTASAVGRVQALEVNISAFETLARLTRFQRLRNQFRRLFSLPGKYPAALTTKSVTSVQKLLLGAVRNMHDLKAVCFDFTRAHDTRQFLSVAHVHEVWSLLSGRVDTLSIYICPDDAHLLPSTFSSILGIKYLYIELRGFRVTEVRGLTELINTSSQSLETFAWKSNFCFIDFSSSIHRSFPILHVFPKLRRADLAVWNTTGSEVTTFLNAHGGSLEELNLEFSHPDGGPPVGVAALQLPSLRTLSIAWNWCKWGGPVTIPFQRLWSGANFPMLSCLEINDPYMKMDHVAFFCDVFRGSGGNRIRRLSFHCEALNAETFDHLSEAFPNLHTLIVTVISLPKPRDILWNIVCCPPSNYLLYSLT
ncbi:hypothetical protein CCMSSC00406_0003443 [Pleurotus cornucopiae]|uniref:Uncharacterized protein n=1 Tax=Pleurotus cornucopiae TaxID=5321 RepID=A0ACB7JAR5_PLECO|nr:hypothetical protein CCMSSC00406_0003443 [Pleurotus cornucopiae]